MVGDHLDTRGFPNVLKGALSEVVDVRINPIKQNDIARIPSGSLVDHSRELELMGGLIKLHSDNAHNGLESMGADPFRTRAQIQRSRKSCVYPVINSTL